jgi:hypothetical protein
MGTKKKPYRVEMLDKPGWVWISYFQAFHDAKRWAVKGAAVGDIFRIVRRDRVLWQSHHFEATTSELSWGSISTEVVIHLLTGSFKHSDEILRCLSDGQVFRMKRFALRLRPEPTGAHDVAE